jgi:hypothetical protein
MPPIMRTAASLHADETRRQLGEARQHLLASELPGDDDLALGIDAVHLETPSLQGRAPASKATPMLRAAIWARDMRRSTASRTWCSSRNYFANADDAAGFIPHKLGAV